MFFSPVLRVRRRGEKKKKKGSSGRHNFVTLPTTPSLHNAGVLRMLVVSAFHTPICVGRVPDYASSRRLVGFLFFFFFTLSVSFRADSLGSKRAMCELLRNNFCLFVF